MVSKEQFLAMTEEERQKVHPVELHASTLTILAQSLDEGLRDKDVVKVFRAIDLVAAVSKDLTRLAEEAMARTAAATSTTAKA